MGQRGFIHIVAVITISLVAILMLMVALMYQRDRADGDDDVRTSTVIACAELSADACEQRLDCYAVNTCNCQSQSELAQRCGLEIDTACECSNEAFARCAALSCTEAVVTNYFSEVTLEPDLVTWEPIDYSSENIQVHMQLPLSWTTSVGSGEPGSYPSIIASNFDSRLYFSIDRKYVAANQTLDDAYSALTASVLASQPSSDPAERTEQWQGKLGSRDLRIVDLYVDDGFIKRQMYFDVGGYIFEIYFYGPYGLFLEQQQSIQRIVGSITIDTDTLDIVNFNDVKDSIESIDWTLYEVDHRNGYIYYPTGELQRAIIEPDFDIATWHSDITPYGILFWKEGPTLSYKPSEDWGGGDISYEGGTNPEFRWYDFDTERFAILPPINFRGDPEQFESVFRIHPSNSEMKLLIEVGEYNIYSEQFQPGMIGQEPLRTHGLSYNIEHNLFDSVDPIAQLFGMTGWSTTEWNSIVWDSVRQRFLAAPGGEGCGAYWSLYLIDIQNRIYQDLGGHGSYLFVGDGCNPHNFISHDGEWATLYGETADGTNAAYLFTTESAPYPLRYITGIAKGAEYDIDWDKSLALVSGWPLIPLSTGGAIDFSTGRVLAANEFPLPPAVHPEVSFDACKGVAGYRDEAWFSDFETSINEYGEGVTLADIQDMCLSLDGSHLVYLVPGGRCEGFDVYWYWPQYGPSQAFSAFMIDHEQECLAPVLDFGKREGFTIPLTGQTTDAGCTMIMEYQYFYSSNITELKKVTSSCEGDDGKQVTEY